MASIQRPHRARLHSRHDMHVLHGEELRGDDRGRAERGIDLRLCAPCSRSIRRIHRRLDDPARLLADTGLRVCLHGSSLGHAGAAGGSSVVDRGARRCDSRHQLVRRAGDFQSQPDLRRGADRGARSAPGTRSRSRFTTARATGRSRCGRSTRRTSIISRASSRRRRFA